MLDGMKVYILAVLSVTSQADGTAAWRVVLLDVHKAAGTVFYLVCPSVESMADWMDGEVVAALVI